MLATSCLVAEISFSAMNDMFSVAPDGQSAACHLEDGRIQVLDLRSVRSLPASSLG